ncbi:hypothetical protein GGR57DRAFT_520777 [Xylariaceae sp. FL1272]|nr:hypothetical protein GGR57DRAFT_520777 [Xylariaceae sp. FL1272]
MSNEDKHKWGIRAAGLLNQAGVAAKKVWQDGTLVRTPRELLTEYQSTMINDRPCDKTELYSYHPLPTPTCIRLLELAPGSPSELIQCKLRVVDLKDNPEYTALSYSWEKDESWTKFAASVAQGLLGDALRHVGINLTKAKSAEDTTGNTKVMICDGKKFVIKPNLYHALLLLRQRAPGNYWIDAVCMNQKDERESNARSVTVWLGECPQLLSPSAARLECAEGNIQQLEEEDKKRGKRRLIGDDSDTYALVCAAYLLSRRWFGRLWVLQEFCLARSLDIQFGQHHIRPETIVGMIHYFKTYYQDKETTKPSMHMFANMFRPFWGFHIKFVPPLLESRQLFQNGRKWSVEEWLYLTRGRSASDSRDFVNAGLALIRQQSLQIDQSLQLEASAPAKNDGPRLWSHLRATPSADKLEVMLNLAACLLTQTQSLFLLSLASMAEDPCLPTWVLEPGTVTHRTIEPLAFYKSTQFQSCESGLDALARTLILDTRLDGIDPVVGLIHYLDYTVFKTRRALQRFSKRNTQKGVQSYLGQKMTASQNDPTPDEAQALLVELNDAWDKLKTIYSDKSWPDYGSTSKPEKTKEYGAFLTMAVKINGTRTLFLTEEGLLALGGCWFEEDERPTVMVVEGGYVPYLLSTASEKHKAQQKEYRTKLDEAMQMQPHDRKRQEKIDRYQARLEFIESRPSPEAGTWALDGEAYVHGFMHGEAMELGRAFEPVAVI